MEKAKAFVKAEFKKKTKRGRRGCFRPDCKDERGGRGGEKPKKKQP